MVFQYQTLNKSFEHNIKSKNNHTGDCVQVTETKELVRNRLHTAKDTGGTSLYVSNEQKTDTSCVKPD